MEKHKLSLIGKITVIKTFALPKLIYPLTVLENPPLDIINTIKKHLFDFLWDNKPDKISRKTIVQNYEKGGLKMIDIDLFINSIKASWVKRITNNNSTGDWKHIYLSLLERVGGNFIFECNIDTKDLKNTLKIKSNFLLDIIQSWSKINYNNNVQNINNEVLWNNSYIINNNKTIFYKTLYDKGLKYINQVFDNRLRLFYTFQYIKNVYALNASDFLKYHTLIQSIPTHWKAKLKIENNLNNNTQQNLLTQISTQKSPNKYLYNIQLNRITNSLVIKPHIKWEQEINNINWKIVHTIPIKSLINTKLRAFQYKYIMRIVPNNNFLFKCNINSTRLCDFCNMFNESNKHLFGECQWSRSFWTELQVFLNVKRIDITLNYEIVSFGYIDQSSYSTLINCILIVAKYFIFKNKYEKNCPSFNNFKKYLKYHESLERLIAHSKDKLQEHDKKWNQLQL